MYQGTVSQTPGSTMTAGGRPLTAVRLGPLTCFCACTPAGAAAAVSEEANSEFFAEEVFDGGSSAAQQASLPPPVEETAPVPAIVLDPPQKPGAAAKPKATPAPLPQAVKESEGSPMKIIVDSSSAAKMEKSPAASSSAGSKAADASKPAAAPKGPSAPAPKAAASAKGKASAASPKNKVKKQKSSGPPPPYCEMFMGKCIGVLLGTSVLLICVAVVLTGALSIAQLISAYPMAQKVQSGLEDSTCSFASPWTDSKEPPSKNYRVDLWDHPLLIPKFMQGLDSNWMGVSCKVELEDLGSTVLYVYDQSRLLKPWSSTLECSTEMPKLFKAQPFPCLHDEQLGVIAALKKDVSNVLALDAFLVIDAGFPMASGIPCALTFALLTALVLFLAKKLAGAALSCWRKISQQRRTCICASVKCLLKWLLCLVLVTVLVLSGWVAYSMAWRAASATKELLSSLQQKPSVFWHDSGIVDASTAPPAAYRIKILDYELDVPSKGLPHTSLEWAIKSCYVTLDIPRDMDGMGTSYFQDNDGLTMVTVFKSDRLLRPGSSLTCADALPAGNQADSCKYATHNPGGWGVLCGIKDTDASWMLFLMRASRSGTPFIFFLVYSLIISLVVIIALLMVLRKIARSIRCRRRKKATAAREMEPDVEALASSVPYRLLPCEPTG